MGEDHDSDLEMVAYKIYNNAINRPNGTEWRFADWKFVKVDATLSPNHSEVKMINPEGNKVESFTVEAYDNFHNFYSNVADILTYHPDDLQDWLDHRREEREQ